jgi:ribosomal protection tetracycline resistance protein
MDKLKNIRNIGVAAHVDAGKTTLTEQLLFKGGAIRNPGSVDKGTAHTDSMEIERERGISVKAAEATMKFGDTEIHIIDTPGHVDFSGEVERALRVLDGAIIVISAVEGVQPQTELYFRALKSLRIPVIFFINKVDRIGADPKRVEGEIKELLTKDVIPFQAISIEEDNIFIESSFDSVSKGFNNTMEALAERNEYLLEAYLEGKLLDKKEVSSLIKPLVHNCEVYPLFYGSALRDLGVDELLQGIVKFLPCPKNTESQELSGLIYKVARDKIMGKLCYVRLYSGNLKSRDEVYNYTRDLSEKATQIKRVEGLKIIDTGEVSSGQFAALAGLNKAHIGDILGNPDMVPPVSHIANPLLTVQVFPDEEKKLTELVDAIRELEEEDPLLYVQWIKEKRELHISIMGSIQLEILQYTLNQRFNLKVSFGQPSVIYKETIRKEGYGFDAYTMPKPCWAILRFKMEPMPKGTGLIYESIVRTEKIKQRYQREVERRVPEALEQGLYGWQVIDLKVTLVEGEDHIFHTHAGDFIVATPMAIMDGLRNIGTTLLEPILSYRISVPEDCGGKILGELVSMRGSFDTPVINRGVFTVEGEVPAATSLEFPVKLAIISSGKGNITTSFSGYKPCSFEQGAVRERVGINPLDRAKYILSIRNAL